MRQFIKGDGPRGSTEAYRNAEAWCACGKRFKAEGQEMCWACVCRTVSTTAKESHGAVWREATGADEDGPPLLVKLGPAMAGKSA